MVLYTHRKRYGTPNIKRTEDKEMTVFRFRVYFEGFEDDVQFRYVVAHDLTMAYCKMHKYIEDLVKEGFARMYYVSEPEVEIENVIY